LANNYYLFCRARSGDDDDDNNNYDDDCYCYSHYHFTFSSINPRIKKIKPRKNLVQLDVVLSGSVSESVDNIVMFISVLRCE